MSVQTRASGNGSYTGYSAGSPIQFDVVLKTELDGPFKDVISRCERLHRDARKVLEENLGFTGHDKSAYKIPEDDIQRYERIARGVFQDDRDRGGEMISALAECRYIITLLQKLVCRSSWEAYQYISSDIQRKADPPAPRRAGQEERKPTQAAVRLLEGLKYYSLLSMLEQIQGKPHPKAELLARWLTEVGLGRGPIMVVTTSIESCLQLKQLLDVRLNTETALLHSKLTEKQHRLNSELYTSHGDSGIMVATVTEESKLGIPDPRWLVHYDLLTRDRDYLFRSLPIPQRRVLVTSNHRLDLGSSYDATGYTTADSPPVLSLVDNPPKPKPRTYTSSKGKRVIVAEGQGGLFSS